VLGGGKEISCSIPILETERLRLRPFTLDDAPDVRVLAGAPEVAATTLHIPHPYPAGAAEEWIGTHTEAAARGDGFAWAIERAEDRALLGGISLAVAAAHYRAEMGYWLGVPFWNQGSTTEAARRVVECGFKEFGLHRIQATCLPRNPASARVMQKAGMSYEGLLRGYVRKGDVFEDLAMYAVLCNAVAG
jgi:[ribosomal protein S5]-alanine N-acetyltransferase